ncbi:MAG TPA: cytochrome c3 family protein [Gemmatimonadales bacterium]|nr:cytochrome c3 family protein [Gemmatimonadales bacterium]
MRGHWFGSIAGAGLCCGVVLFIGGCKTTEVQYVAQPQFKPGPDSTNGFLGYYTVSTKQTNCGNCHVSAQTSWIGTKHAQAWADLQGSGHASSSCNGCHAVSQLGNSVGHPAGYLVASDSAYHDVQCENCHGPGHTHASSPTQANEPLASIHVDTGLTNGCGGCHTGVHEPFVDQWVQSAHGSGPGFAHAVGNTSCTPCHEGKAAMTVKFHVTGAFVEKTDTSNQRIVCTVCHDPHGTAGYEGQLRASIATPTTDNLCVSCHSRTATPPWPVATGTSASRGPHGAQGLLVIGQNVGWIPPNFQYDTNQIVSSHGTAANPRLCATCHVSTETITDKATGAFQFQSVGHLFTAASCIDPGTGLPTTSTSCPIGQRDFNACVNSGCHLTAQAASSAFQAEQASLDNLLDQLWVDSNNNGIIDATDGGLLAQMVARGSAADSAQLNFGSSTTTVAKGTIWNAALGATDDRTYWLAGTVFGKSWAAHASAGNGVHNPFLLEALLSASIAALHTASGLTPTVPLDLRIRATPPPGVRVRLSSRQ